MKNKKNSIKKNKRILFTGILFLVSICILFITVKAINGKKYYTISTRVNNVTRMNKDYEEVIGWLKVQGTNIDYPIVDFSKLKEDPEYDYLWKNTSDTTLEDKVTIVGHNIRNVSKEPLITEKDHTRFEQLMSFVNSDFVKDNQYIQYTVNGKNYLYKIYAVTFSSEEEENKNLSFSSSKQKKEYIKNVKKNSLFDYKIDVDEKDKLISLVTCTRMFGYENANVKFKVEGRLVRKKENVKKYKVSTSKYYNDILGGSLL